MKDINYAYRILTDADLRYIYDRGGSAEVKKAEQFREYRIYDRIRESPWYVKALVVLFGLLSCCYFCCFCCCCCCCCCGRAKCVRTPDPHDR
ncbi:DnaJ subfamily C member 5B [Blattella germanica]|nr:DnaJ subfamily C member 5B [Blattella germanica]